MTSRDTPIQTVLDLPDADATSALGACLGPHLQPGDFLALEGTLGAGKTHLARALIHASQRAAGEALEDVPSPSYTLVQIYSAGAQEIWHADLYRLSDPGDVAELGLEAAHDAGAICLVEWPDRMADRLPPDRISLRLSIESDGRGDTRRAEITLPANRADIASALKGFQQAAQHGQNAGPAT